MITGAPKQIHRYPGLKPFAYYEQGIFYGRDLDIQALLKLIQVHTQLVLYGKSGHGKSSLINAGVLPGLEKEAEYWPIRIRMGAFHQNSLLEMVSSHIYPASDLDEPPFLAEMKESLPEIWYQLKWALWNAPPTRIPILIFDQFEEIFTYPADQIKRFKKQVADVLHHVIPRKIKERIEKQGASVDDDILRKVYDPLNAKAVFVIRSDKMSLLDNFKDVMPEILSRTYELKALDRIQAEDAIIYPAYQKGEQFLSQRFDFSDEALDTILDYLTKGGDQEVESFQLQVICQFVEQKVLQEEKKVIQREDLGELNDIFENFYENMIHQLPDEEDRQLARRLVEDGLVLEGEEIRLSLHEGQILRDYEMPESLLERLVNTRLVRTEPSPRGGFLYELSHDTLIKPILKAKKKRMEAEAEARLAAMRQEEEEAREAERRREKKKLRWALIGTIVVSLAGIAAIIAAVYIWQLKRQAELTEQRLDEQLQAADALLVEIRKKDSLLQETQDLLATLNKMGERMENSPARTQESPSPATSIPAQAEREKILTRIKDVEAAIEDRKATEEPNLQSSVANLFDRSEYVRKSSLSDMLRSWNPNPELVNSLINHSRKNMDNDQGLFNTLYLLDRVPGEVLLKEKENVLTFLKEVEEKGYGKTTQSRITRIRNKLGNAYSR